MSEQLFVTIAVGPVLSLIIVLAGYIVQNINLNARTAEMRNDMNGRFAEIKADMNTRFAEMRADTNTRFNEMRGELRDVMQAEFRANRAEMERQHSELLAKFAELDHRVGRLEQVVRR